MLASVIESMSQTAASMSLQEAAICMAAALVLGLVIAGVYMLTGTYSTNFVISLVVLPVLVQGVIIMVNGNLGTSVAVLGAFGLVRFRSVPGSSRDIVSIFFAMAIGLAAGMGQIGYAAILTFIVSAVLLVLHFGRFGMGRGSDQQLKITIPENLDYSHVFDDVFHEFLNSHSLMKVKTTNLGTMYELTYMIRMKDPDRQKEMIDELRCRNGNLTIICGRPQAGAEVL